MSRKLLPATKNSNFLSFTGAISVASATLLVNQSASTAYAEAKGLRAGDAFREIRKDEDQHVSFLKKALGSYARPKPEFKHLKQSELGSFIKLSQVFENVGVGAYLLAAPFIANKGYLAAAGSIRTIEAVMLATSTPWSACL